MLSNEKLCMKYLLYEYERIKSLLIVNTTEKKCVLFLVCILILFTREILTQCNEGFHYFRVGIWLLSSPRFLLRIRTTCTLAQSPTATLLFALLVFGDFANSNRRRDVKYYIYTINLKCVHSDWTLCWTNEKLIRIVTLHIYTSIYSWNIYLMSISIWKLRKQ